MRIASILLLCLCTGCFPLSAPFHLHLVNEERGALSPIPCQFKVHFGWQTATIVATLNSGEACQGHVNLVGSATPPDRDMAPLWDRIFGQGFFNAQVLGSAGHSRVVLLGDRGTEIRLEFHRKAGDQQGGLEGVAIDKAGQIYKMGY
jgi:hypothetical protein